MISLQDTSTGDSFTSFYPEGLDLSRKYDRHNKQDRKNPKWIVFDNEQRLVRIDMEYTPPLKVQHPDLGTVIVNGTFWSGTPARYDGYVDYCEHGKAEKDRPRKNSALNE